MIKLLRCVVLGVGMERALEVQGGAKKNSVKPQGADGL